MKILGQKSALIYLNEGLRRQRLSPSLLFVGADGVGKRTTALECVKALFCRTPKTEAAVDELIGCDACDICHRVQENNHPDMILIDATLQAVLLKEKPESQNSVKIESVRHLDKFLQIRPLEAPRRVAIIEQAERMTNEAANALLKTLEEPPMNAQIILLATDASNLPSTIMSRCAVVRFALIPGKRIAEWLYKQSVDLDEAEDIADRCGGSLSKALEMKGKEIPHVDFSNYRLDEFFELLGELAWKKDGRQKAIEVVNHLIELSQRKLEKGDDSQKQRLEKLLEAREQLDRFVSPRLVLENIYLKLEPVFKN